MKLTSHGALSHSLAMAGPGAQANPTSLQWLVRLRWISLCGLVVCAAFAKSEGQALRWSVVVTVIGIGVVSNAVLALWSGRRAYVIAPALLLDMVLLTACLAATGGASNPFSVLYLVHIALAAVVLTSRQTLAMAAASVVLFAMLFLVDVGPVHLHNPSASLFENKHLQGMWLAFTLAALITGYFVSRIAATLQAQREQIASLREANAKHARLASLTTLAAGAAHELATPLGTIAVAAYEMRAASQGNAADLDLILAEVQRCQHIIGQLAPRGREGEAVIDIKLEDIARNLQGRMGQDWERIVLQQEAPFSLTAPSGLVHSTIAAIVKNALDASAAPVVVKIGPDKDGTSVTVCDRGEGMSPETMQHIGEPFFTTKEPGKGMGLGVFLAQSSMAALGGTLRISSVPSHGTEVMLVFPQVSPYEPSAALPAS